RCGGCTTGSGSARRRRSPAERTHPTMREVTAVVDRAKLERWLPLVVLPPILLLDGLLSEKGPDVTLLSVPIAYVAVLPLALRERLGFFGMAPLLVGGVVLVLWNFEPGT